MNRRFSRLWHIASVATLLLYSFVPLSQAHAQDCSPLINVDQPTADASIQGQATFSGWALDQDASGDSGISGVQVVADNTLDQGGTLLANASEVARPDVDASLGVTGTFGFNANVNLNNLPSGTHTFYVYAETDCGPAYTTISADITPGLFHIDSPSSGTTVSDGQAVTISGWVAGKNVDVYLDGPVGQGTLVGSSPVNVSRPDVASQTGNPNSGFNVTWTPSGLSAGSHTLYIYSAINGQTVNETLAVQAGQSTAPSFSSSGSSSTSSDSSSSGGSAGSSPTGLKIQAPGSGASISPGQTISGYAVDCTTGQPASVVQIYQGNAGSGTLLGTAKTQQSSASVGTACGNDSTAQVQAGWTFSLGSVTLNANGGNVAISAAAPVSAGTATDVAEYSMSNSANGSVNGANTGAASIATSPYGSGNYAASTTPEQFTSGLISGCSPNEAVSSPYGASNYLNSIRNLNPSCGASSASCGLGASAPYNAAAAQCAATAAATNPYCGAGAPYNAAAAQCAATAAATNPYCGAGTPYNAAAQCGTAAVTNPYCAASAPYNAAAQCGTAAVTNPYCAASAPYNAAAAQCAATAATSPYCAAGAPYNTAAAQCAATAATNPYCGAGAPYNAAATQCGAAASNPYCGSSYPYNNANPYAAQCGAYASNLSCAAGASYNPATPYAAQCNPSNNQPYFGQPTNASMAACDPNYPTAVSGLVYEPCTNASAAMSCNPSAPAGGSSYAAYQPCATAAALATSCNPAGLAAGNYAYQQCANAAAPAMSCNPQRPLGGAGYQPCMGMTSSVTTAPNPTAPNPTAPNPTTPSTTVNAVESPPGSGTVVVSWTPEGNATNYIVQLLSASPSGDGQPQTVGQPQATSSTDAHFTGIAAGTYYASVTPSGGGVVSMQSMSTSFTVTG